MNGLPKVLETAICLLVPIGILIVAAIFGTRSRLRYMRRIQEAQSRGAFADLNSSENKARLRRLGAIGLVAVLGTAMSSAVLIFQMANKVSNHYAIIVSAMLFFGVVGTIAGFLLQREINRRL